MKNRLPKNFVKEQSDNLLEFIYDSFQERYEKSKVDEDDTPVGNEPSFVYELGNWKYEDRFYGGEPYSGIITIFWKNIPCWVMTVHGKLIPNLTHEQTHSAYLCLYRALISAPKNFPFRGPSAYTLSASSLPVKISYSNNGHGNVVKCYGKESVKQIDAKNNETWLIEGDYFGQIVNLYG